MNNPSHWSYLSEGGKHAIFIYQPLSGYDDSNDHNLQPTCRNILRIKKCDLVSAAKTLLTEASDIRQRQQEQKLSSSEKCHKREESDNDDVVDEILAAKGRMNEDEHFSFIRYIIEPLLKPYVDVPEIRILQPSFVASLYRRAIDSNKIPVGRQKDWVLFPDDTKKELLEAQQDSYRATLLYNYKQATMLSLENFVASTNTRTTVSLEIKPKCGYITTSPLVHPLHRMAKYNHTRFYIHQQLQYDGHLTKGWRNIKNSVKLQKKSKYDPLKLFSEDKKQIKETIKELFDCQQNNLKVWYDNNQRLYCANDEGANGYDEDDIKEILIYKQLYNQFFGINSGEDKSGCRGAYDSTNNGYKDIVAKKLQEITSHVLASEPFLGILLDLQKLDIIDADGAVVIYEHMVELCNGSHDSVHTLLDTYSTPNLRKRKNMHEYDNAPVHNLLSKSPFIDTDSDELFDLCECCAASSWTLQHRERYALEHLEESFENRHKSSVDLVHELQLLDCRCLLQNWLLSLAMSDISFFVTIYPATGADVSNVDRSNCLNFVEGDSFQVARRQDCNNPGLVIENISGTHPRQEISQQEGRAWFYIIKVIDCDSKPATKLQNRKKVEEVVRHFRSAAAPGEAGRRSA